MTPMGVYQDDALPDSFMHTTTHSLRGMPAAAAMASGGEDDAELMEEEDEFGEEWVHDREEVEELSTQQGHGTNSAAQGGAPHAAPAKAVVGTSAAPQRSAGVAATRADPLRVASPLLPVVLGGWDGIGGSTSTATKAGLSSGLHAAAAAPAPVPARFDLRRHGPTCDAYVELMCTFYPSGVLPFLCSAHQQVGVFLGHFFCFVCL